MEISNIEKVVSYFNSICEKLPIGGYGIKILHDALYELAVLKAIGAPAEQPGNTSPKLPTIDEFRRWADDNEDYCLEDILDYFTQQFRAGA